MRKKREGKNGDGGNGTEDRKPSTRTKTERLSLRIPEGLKQAIESEAREKERPMTWLVVRALEARFRVKGSSTTGAGKE